MPSEVLDRAEVARGLQKEFEDIKTSAKQFCLPDASLVMLRLEDVYDDWRSGEFSRLLYPDERRDQEEIQATAYFRRASYLLWVGDIALSLLLENGRQCGRQLTSFPHIFYVISPKPPSETDEEITVSGRRGPNDACFFSSVNILGTIPTTEVLILKGAAGTEAEEFMSNILVWHKRLMIYLSKRRAVRKGKDMKIEQAETGEMLVTEEAHSEDELLDIFMKERATPRHLVGTAWHAALWASDFQEISRENFRNIDSPRDPSLNIDYATREEDEIARAYGSFPGFKNLFESMYRLDYDSFAKVNRVLIRLVMLADQHVHYGTLKNMLKALEKDTGLSKNECGRIIASMTWKHGEAPLRYPVYANGLYRYTSYRRLSAARSILLDSLFSEVYRHEDEKGRMFEERCRDLLRRSGLKVRPTRLLVPFQIVSTEVSEGLWGKSKTETDFDVLARAGRFCLIIECKETKIPFQKLLRKTNLFEKYVTELYYKACWVRDNSSRFMGLMHRDKSDGDLFEGVDYLIPLIVTTYPFDIGASKISLLTYSELGTLAKSFNRVSIEMAGDEEYAALPWRNEDRVLRTLALPFKVNEK